MPRRDKLERTGLGRRVRSLVGERRGKYARHRLGQSADIAIDATVRAAAARAGAGRPLPLAVDAHDLRRKLREHRSPLAVCFLVDNSYSLHAERMIETVKGLAERLLEDATHRGDKVALVAFKSGLPEGTVALPLTKSASLARRRLAEIPLSGRTPLADALARARRLLGQELAKHPNAVPLVVCLTDGLPTAARRPGGDPLADALDEARALRRAKVGLVMVDAAPETARAKSPSRTLADTADGLYLRLEELTPSAFASLLEEVR